MVVGLIDLGDQLFGLGPEPNLCVKAGLTHGYCNHGAVIGLALHYQQPRADNLDNDQPKEMRGRCLWPTPAYLLIFIKKWF